MKNIRCFGASFVSAAVFVLLSACSQGGDSPNNSSTTVSTVSNPSPQSFVLSVTVSGNGTVTSNPAGIQCGASCNASYASNTSVTLTATPASGHMFSGWGGVCSGASANCTVSMTAARNVSATFNTGLPAAPSSLTANPGNAQVTLTWNSVTGATGYKVYRGTTVVGSPTSNSFTHTGLTNGTSYTYQVSATNSAGEGTKSNAVTATPNASSGACALPKYPSASCTGVPAGTALTTVNGDLTTSSNGQVIDGKLIKGDVFIHHDNVIIRNSEIHGHIKNNDGPRTTFTVEDSTVGPPSGCVTDAAIGINNYTLNRVHLRNFAEGARVERQVTPNDPNATPTPISEGGDVVVRNSYFKFCNPNSDNHADAIQGFWGGHNIVFEHNTVDMRDIPIHADYTTATIFWSDGSGNNVLFKDNLISGGSFTIRIHVGTGHTVTGNKVINNSWLHGPVYSNCGVINWSDNHIVEIDANYDITQIVSTLACAD